MNDQPNTETAPMLVGKYNGLVAQAQEKGVTAEHVGLKTLGLIKVFHDRATALSRIAQMEAAIMGAEMTEAYKWDEGQPAQGARVSYSANGDTAGTVKQAAKTGGTVALVVWDSGPEQWEPIGRLWSVHEEMKDELGVRTSSEHNISITEILQSSPGRARLLAHPDAEKIRQAVIEDQTQATEAVASREESDVAAKKEKKPRAKKEKATNGEANGTRGRKARFTDEQKITVLAEENPRRGPAKEAFGCYRTGSTVGTVVARMVEKCAISRGKALQHVAHDHDAGSIMVD